MSDKQFSRSLIELQQPFLNRKVRYELLSLTRLEESVELLCRDFRLNEPLGRHLDLPVAEFRPFILDLLQHACVQHLSWVAIDAANESVIGIRIVTDLKNDFQPRHSYGSKMDIILSFLDSVGRHEMILRDFQNHRAMHAHIVSVNELYTGMKVASNLFHHATKWGQSRGYSILTGEITSYFNRKILSNLGGYICLAEVDYRTYEMCGVRPFSDIDHPHDSCVSYVIDLDCPEALERRDQHA